MQPEILFSLYNDEKLVVIPLHKLRAVMGLRGRGDRGVIRRQIRSDRRRRDFILIKAALIELGAGHGSGAVKAAVAVGLVDAILLTVN